MTEGVSVHGLVCYMTEGVLPCACSYLYRTESACVYCLVCLCLYMTECKGCFALFVHVSMTLSPL